MVSPWFLPFFSSAEGSRREPRRHASMRQKAPEPMAPHTPFPRKGGPGGGSVTPNPQKEYPSGRGQLFYRVIPIFSLSFTPIFLKWPRPPGWLRCARACEGLPSSLLAWRQFAADDPVKLPVGQPRSVCAYHANSRPALVIPALCSKKSSKSTKKGDLSRVRSGLWHFCSMANCNSTSPRAAQAPPHRNVLVVHLQGSQAGAPWCVKCARGQE